MHLISAQPARGMCACTATKKRPLSRCLATAQKCVAAKTRCRGQHSPPKDHTKAAEGKRHQRLHVLTTCRRPHGGSSIARSPISDSWAPLQNALRHWCGGAVL